MPQGPRIIFKDDRDSSIGRGCVLYRAHLRPEVMRIVYAAALTAPTLKDNTLVVSEGWRDIRDRRDLHEEARAFDISLNQLEMPNTPVIIEERKIVGDAWGARMRAELGTDYQVVVHGEGANLHIHIELDP